MSSSAPGVISSRTPERWALTWLPWSEDLLPKPARQSQGPKQRLSQTLAPLSTSALAEAGVLGPSGCYWETARLRFALAHGSPLRVWDLQSPHSLSGPCVGTAVGEGTSGLSAPHSRPPLSPCSHQLDLQQARLEGGLSLHLGWIVVWKPPYHWLHKHLGGSVSPGRHLGLVGVQAGEGSAGDVSSARRQSRAPRDTV